MRRIVIDCDPGHDDAVGRTVCDLWSATGRPANADVAIGIDRAGLVALLEGSLRRFPA